MSPFVVRGLRVLPSLQLARRRNPDAVSLFFDCDNCKKTQTETTRQYLGCGYLPPPDPKLPVRPWDGESVGRSPEPDELDENRRLHLPVCPGYVCALPEVSEVWHAYQYWKNGELTQFCEGQSTQALRAGIRLLSIAEARADEWDNKNPVKS